MKNYNKTHAAAYALGAYRTIASTHPADACECRHPAYWHQVDGCRSPGCHCTQFQKRAPGSPK